MNDNKAIDIENDEDNDNNNHSSLNNNNNNNQNQNVGVLELEKDDDDNNNNDDDYDEQEEFASLLVSSTTTKLSSSSSSSRRRTGRMGTSTTTKLLSSLAQNRIGRIITIGFIIFIVIIFYSGNNNNNNNNKQIQNQQQQQQYYYHIYKRRGRKLVLNEEIKLKDEWGYWSLDEKKTIINGITSNNNHPPLPKSIQQQQQLQDLYNKYPNRDIPYNEFPNTSWQKNTKYVGIFLKESIQLIERTMDAILKEYGQQQRQQQQQQQQQSTTTTSSKTSNYETKRNFYLNSMFGITIFDDLTKENIEILKDKNNNINNKIKKHGGWTTKQSWNNLQKRLLHSIMIEDSFNFVMGGHSAAAGHGNHFQQSYTMQVQKILEPIFARLGVSHISRNIANGGMGTIHNAMGAGSIYGPDISILMWDSSMTEKNLIDLDLFARQGLLSSGYDTTTTNNNNKVPILWNLPIEILEILHNNVTVDIGTISTGSSGIIKANRTSDLNNIPYSQRYMKCNTDLTKFVCDDDLYKYNGTCWINRSDVNISKIMKQKNIPDDGRTKWHPGHRQHQLKGRIITFTILLALYDALNTWYSLDNYILSNDMWHITNHYNTIRTKLQTLDESIGSCYLITKNNKLPSGFCKYPIKARTEFTPRAYPSLSNIRTLMPYEMVKLIPNPKQNVYNPPDVFNPILHAPIGEIDVLNIVELGSKFNPIQSTTSISSKDITNYYNKYNSNNNQQQQQQNNNNNNHILNNKKLQPGKGISLSTMGSDHLCNGSYDSFCHRTNDNNCLLYGHNDNRGHLKFDSYSGWILLTLKRIQYGIIVLKLQTWHSSESNIRTEGWTSINNYNNNNNNKKQSDENNNNNTNNNTNNTNRELKNNNNEDGPNYCNDFKFEYVINGNLTSLNKDEFLDRKQNIQRVVETITLLDDPNFVQQQQQQQQSNTNNKGEGEGEIDVDVAIRIVGCQRKKVLSLTHVYWA